MRDYLANVDRVAEDPPPAFAQVIKIHFNPVYAGLIGDVGAVLSLQPALDDLSIFYQMALRLAWEANLECHAVFRVNHHPSGRSGPSLEL